MSDTDIINGNKSIADMLGWHYVPWTEVKEASALLGIPIHSGGWYKPKNGFVKELRFKGRTHYDLCFHKDWNRIFEALKFIEEYGYSWIISKKTFFIGKFEGRQDTRIQVEDDDLLKSVFYTLHKFAVLYNNKEV